MFIILITASIPRVVVLSIGLLHLCIGGIADIKTVKKVYYNIQHVGYFQPQWYDISYAYNTVSGFVIVIYLNMFTLLERFGYIRVPTTGIYLRYLPDKRNHHIVNPVGIACSQLTTYIFPHLPDCCSMYAN